jgi:hypothetical protein
MDYQGMTVVELKDALRAQGKPVSGKKADLIARLATPLAQIQAARATARAAGAQKAHQTRAAVSPHRKNYDGMKVDELKAALRTRGLKVSGTKSELVRRLAYNDAGMEEPKTPTRRATGKGKGKGAATPRRGRTPKPVKPIVLENIKIAPRPAAKGKGKGKGNGKGTTARVPVPGTPRLVGVTTPRVTGVTARPTAALLSPRTLTAGLDAMKVEDLKNQLRARGLTLGGNKEALKARLVEALKA